MADTIKMKMCLICNKQVPEDIFEKHFVSCRKNRLNNEQEKVNVQRVVQNLPPVKKGCGCGRK